jgi:hypothetical protein
MSSNLEREIELYRFSAGFFPEYSVRIVQCLRKFNKEVESSLAYLYQRVLGYRERYSKYAVQGRSSY